jgi:hypothetical protein
MMLPDNENFLQKAFKIAKRFFSEDNNLNKKNYLLEQTLQAMFYQLNKDEDERIIFETIDQAFKYLSEIYQDIRFYFLNKRQYDVDHLMGTFFGVLLQIFKSNNIQNLNLIIGVLILANKALKKRSYNPKDWFFYLSYSINKYEPEKLFECLK